MDNDDLYQILLGVSAVAGYLGTGALLAQLPWLPSPLGWLLAPFVGYAYGEFQAQMVCQFPRIRERGEVSTNGLCKVGCSYFVILILVGILFPVFHEASRKERVARHRPPPYKLPSWTPYAAMALPVTLTGIVAVVGWGLHASERRRGPAEHGQPAVSSANRRVRRKRPHSRRR